MDGAGDAYFFDLLPGTRMEGERVGTRLRVSPWLDATALEGRLKAECRSPRILHLATHGFFLPDQERASTARPGASLSTPVISPARRAAGTGSPGPLLENPMLRSSLALAGANAWLTAARRADAGVGLRP